MAPVDFAIIGGGWRAEFFLRCAAALPERFNMPAMLVRDAEKGAALEARFPGARTHRNLDALLGASRPLFAVVIVPQALTPDFVETLIERGVPALAETPPAREPERLAQLCALARRKGVPAQTAEQYIFQPLHAAYLAIIASGKLGRVSQARVACAHGYHGVSLIRHMLGVEWENATITAHAFDSPLIAGRNRVGLPPEEKIANSKQTLALLDFGDRLGVFDFCDAQYFSWVRANRLLVRGERGELVDRTLYWLPDFRTPMEAELRRMDAGDYGNLEGYYHKGIIAGEQWVYENPYAPARLSDDEIAVAALMDKMAAHCQGGPSFYSLAEGAQDQYLTLKITEALKAGAPVKTERQPWAE